MGLVASLAIGLLIGLERGWRGRELSEGGRVAGLRTFALTGLLGGLLASFGDAFGAGPLLAGVIGVSLLLAVSYRTASQTSGDLSITSAIAMLLTLVLGALAGRGAIAPALAAAVVAAVLLAQKSTLHRWLQLIEHSELTTGLQLLVLSVVILPNLPDEGFGPYLALNPYRLWWAVVLLAGLSLAGHVAMRVTGEQRGLFWTGALGGVASSTTATLALARHARQHAALAGAAAAGALAASAVMCFRMTVLIASVQPALLRPLGAPLMASGAVLLGASLWQWRSRSPAVAQAMPEPLVPFDLGTALGFTAFLAVMAVLVPAAQQWLGTPGIYALAALTGLADVDATVISVSRLHGHGGVTEATAVAAVGLTTLANMFTKASIAAAIGGAGMGWPVLRGYALGMATGALAWVAIG